MGILNVTPDSFSDGGAYRSPEDAVARALEMASQGAAILDLGGESTRPGSKPVSAEEELRRVLPVLRKLSGKTSAVISVDTTKAAVAREAIGAGARIVNDTSALSDDPDMAAFRARIDAELAAEHHVEGVRLGAPRLVAELQTDDLPRSAGLLLELANQPVVTPVALFIHGLDARRARDGGALVAAGVHAADRRAESDRLAHRRRVRARTERRAAAGLVRVSQAYGLRD